MRKTRFHSRSGALFTPVMLTVSGFVFAGGESPDEMLTCIRTRSPFARFNAHQLEMTDVLIAARHMPWTNQQAQDAAATSSRKSDAALP